MLLILCFFMEYEWVVFRIPWGHFGKVLAKLLRVGHLGSQMSLMNVCRIMMLWCIIMKFYPPLLHFWSLKVSYYAPAQQQPLTSLKIAMQPLRGSNRVYSAWEYIKYMPVHQKSKNAVASSSRSKVVLGDMSNVDSVVKWKKIPVTCIHFPYGN